MTSKFRGIIGLILVLLSILNFLNSMPCSIVILINVHVMHTFKDLLGFIFLKFEPSLEIVAMLHLSTM